MAHKTMVDGTAYGISGGKTLIDGTAFSIKGGKTLVDGTAYEVGFAPSGATVTISVQDVDYGARVIIDGVTYGTARTELTVPIGTVITCKANQVQLNSVGQVGSNQYDYTVTGNVVFHCTGTQVNPYYKLSIVQIIEQ